MHCRLTLELSGRRPQTSRSYRSADPGGSLERIVRAHSLCASGAGTQNANTAGSMKQLLIEQRKKYRFSLWVGLELFDLTKLSQILFPKRVPLFPLSWRGHMQFPVHAYAFRTAVRTQKSSKGLVLALQFLAGKAHERTITHKWALTLELSGRCGRMRMIEQTPLPRSGPLERIVRGR